MKKIVISIVLSLIMIISCGCWDRIEIEKNAFILGIGIDIGQDDTLAVTYQIALPQGMGGGNEGQGSGDDTSSTLNITIEGKNLKNTEQLLMSHIDRYPNYTHLKSIVFGEELSRQGLSEHVDFLFRNPQTRRLTKVSVCEGEAKELFKIQPKTTKSTAQYIDSLLNDNSRYSIFILSKVDLTQLEDRFLNNLDFYLTKLVPQEETIEVQGAGIFKEDKLVGWLSPQDISAIKWISDEVDRGVFDIISPVAEAQVTLEIISSSSKISPIQKEDSFTFKIDIELETDIAEVSEFDCIVLDEGAMDVIKQSINDEVKKLCKASFYNIRDDYNTDVYGFSKKVSNYYPLFWEENKDNWSDYFSRSDIMVEIDTSIRQVGLIK